jgi:excisionase family DNA binding protein
VTKDAGLKKSAKINDEAISGPAFLTVEEAAGLLRIGLSAAYDMCNRGDLPAVRLGSRVLRVPRAALDQLVREQLSGTRLLRLPSADTENSSQDVAKANHEPERQPSV